MPEPISRNDALLVLRATLTTLGSAQDVEAACPQGGTLTLSYEGEEIAECPLDDVDLIHSSCGDYADVCGLDADDFC